MTRRKPRARTKERAMIVFRPAVGIVTVGWLRCEAGGLGLGVC